MGEGGVLPVEGGVKALKEGGRVQTDRLYTGARPCQADVGRPQENGSVLKTIRARQR